MPRTKSHEPAPPRVRRRFLSRMRRHAASIVFLLVLPFSQGCYSYHTTSLPQVQPEEEIRITLEEQGYRRVAPGAGLNSAPRVEGRFGGMTGDSLTLRVWIGEAYAGTPFYSTYQNVMLPLNEVQRVEHRRLSKGRTAAVAAGVLVGIGALIESVGWIDVFGSGDENGPPDPPEPVLSFRIRFR